MGALAGLAFALYAMWETLTVTVNEQELSLTAKGKQRTFTKDQIAAAFFDADRLVLLGHDTHELAREKSDVTRSNWLANCRNAAIPG